MTHRVFSASLTLSLACTGSGPSDATDAPVEVDPPCVNAFEPSVRPPLEDGQAPAEDALPETLMALGLYVDGEVSEVHPAIVEFEPRFPLWSDGSDKTRWVYLPECAVIDGSDPDDWVMPVGMRLFKEFRLGGKRLETRVIERIADGGYAYASYVWNDAETDAVRVGPEGAEQIKGFDHAIPSKQACLRCHGTHGEGGGRPSRALGFGAIQLAHDRDGLTLVDLVEQARVHPPPERQELPGDSVAHEALGYLHANCGHCHNSTPDRVQQVDLNLWLDVGLERVEDSGAWRTAVDQPNAVFADQHVTARIDSVDSGSSAVLYRMLQRGNNAQMPPIGSHTVDEDGVKAVRAWIEQLQ